MYLHSDGNIRSLRGWYTAVAWLSSARDVSCSLKWGNERNPYSVLLCHRRLPSIIFVGRKEGTTSSQHDAYVQGYTHPTMTCTTSCNTARLSQSLKTCLSGDCSLKLDCMNLELVVIADQQTAVNTFSPLAHTARQISKVGGTQRLWLARD